MPTLTWAMMEIRLIEQGYQREEEWSRLCVLPKGAKITKIGHDQKVPIKGTIIISRLFKQRPLDEECRPLEDIKAYRKDEEMDFVATEWPNPIPEGHLVVAARWPNGDWHVSFQYKDKLDEIRQAGEVIVSAKSIVTNVGYIVTADRIDVATSLTQLVKPDVSGRTANDWAKLDNEQPFAISCPEFREYLIASKTICYFFPFQKTTIQDLRMWLEKHIPESHEWYVEEIMRNGKHIIAFSAKSEESTGLAHTIIAV